MSRSSETWILLIDPDELGKVDGTWGAGIGLLCSGHPPPSEILTEPRVAACVRLLSEETQVIVADLEEPLRRFESAPLTSGGWLELLLLQHLAQSLKSGGWIRSFGLRAGLLASILSRQMGRPHSACLPGGGSTWVCPPPDQQTAGASDLPGGTGMKEHRSRQRNRYLKAWVALRAERVVAVDRAEARRLQADLLIPHLREVDVLPLSGCGGGAEISGNPAAGRASTPPPQEEPGSIPGEFPPGSLPAPEEREVRIAVLPSGSDPPRNRTALEAIRPLLLQDRRPEINWLARRGTYASMRALQEFRRLELGTCLRWREEPWKDLTQARRRPGRLGGPVWDLLLWVDGGAGISPLLWIYLSQGGRLVHSEDVDEVPPIRMGESFTPPPARDRGKPQTQKVHPVPWERAALWELIQVILTPS